MLIKLTKPCARIHSPYICKELDTDVADVESLLPQCVLENSVHDQIIQSTNSLNWSISRGMVHDVLLPKINSLNYTMISKLA